MFWPSLKIGENEYKLLNECNRQETQRLLDHLYERYTAMMNLPGYMTPKRQMANWIAMTEARLERFYSQELIDPEDNKPEKTRTRLLD